MSQFKYLRDKLFLMALVAYTVNRLVVLPHLGGWVSRALPWLWPFLYRHFDDTLLIPAALPVVLWIQRLLRLRQHDAPPTWPEMAMHLLVWTVMAKVIGPFYCHLGVADPWDIPCFMGGGIVACLWWQHRAPHFQPQPVA